MEIPQGYKRSEFGIIPEDWIEAKWGDCLVTFSSGATPYRGVPAYYKGNVKWISSGELNYNVISDTIEHISEQAVRDTNLKVHQPGTMLIAITGLEAEGTRGRCALVGTPATTNQSCLALNGTDKVCIEYLFEFYKMFGCALAFKYCQGTKQQSYTAEIVKKLPIIYPRSIDEQKAIAKKISEIDELIAGLGEQIEKKRQIKEGAMQQLLTGKSRLPGFGQPWVEKELDDIADIEMGQSPSSAFYNNDSIGLPLIQGNADLEKRKSIVRFYTSQITKQCDAGDIIMSVRAPVGAIGKASYKSCLGRGVCAFRGANDFLYHYLIFIEPYWGEFSKGSTFDSINSDDLKHIKVFMPSDSSEQSAIAQILSDMGDEIIHLEAERDKYTLIKQGMMQELLTGKTRLV